MSSEYPRFKIFITLFGGILGALGGGVVALVFALFAGGGGRGSAHVISVVWLPFMIAGYLLVVAWGFLSVVKARASYRKEEARNKAERSRAAKRDAQRKTQSYRGSIIKHVEASTELFESLPVNASNAVTHRINAHQHFENGAFSPFWGSIESAYANLGSYNLNLNKISDHADHYASLVQGYYAGGGIRRVPNFPVHVDSINAAKVAESISISLGQLTYKAQRHPIFAQIWEQRRTTAAVVEGFQNLESAVNGMTSLMVGSLNEFASSVDSSLNATTVAIDAAKAASAVTNSEQTRIMQETSVRVDKATWYLEQEYNRGVGRI